MLRTSAVTSLLALLLSACGDDGTGPGQVSLNDLAYSWTISRWEYSLASDPAQKVDWVSADGLTGTLTITNTGAFTVTPMLPSGFADDFGQLTLDGDSLYWDGENDEEWVHFTLQLRTLTLNWPETEVVDMDHNGEPEDVWLKVVLQR